MKKIPNKNYKKLLKEKAEVACEALQDLAFIVFEQGVRKAEELVGRLQYKVEKFKKYQKECLKNKKD